MFLCVSFILYKDQHRPEDINLLKQSKFSTWLWPTGFISTQKTSGQSFLEVNPVSDQFNCESSLCESSMFQPFFLPSSSVWGARIISSELASNYVNLSGKLKLKLTWKPIKTNCARVHLTLNVFGFTCWEKFPRKLINYLRKKTLKFEKGLKMTKQRFSMKTDLFGSHVIWSNFSYEINASFLRIYVHLNIDLNISACKACKACQ